MVVDYVSLKEENERRYGTDIGRIGGMLLADRYDKRTHFIFELLQNAEDALRRRDDWHGSRAVSFYLTASELRISHYGQPFDEADVRGICGIDESTKDITSIGRFGIGFKSVYAFTNRPEIHSGTEAFAIENYVWPVAVKPFERDPDQTVIVLPLKEKNDKSRAELIEGFENLGARALLFLRHVNEISWSVQDGPSGLYFRHDPVRMDNYVYELALSGKQQGKPDVEERWLVFSREAHHENKLVGHAAIAFSLKTDASETPRAIQPLDESQLIVFFPTVLQTHLGFLVQGPYRTTPSRDNVPPSDPWNRHLVRETGDLLVDALRWLAARKQLDLGAIQTLPLDRAKFSNGLLASLFSKVVEAMNTEPLLPTSDGSYVVAPQALLSRAQDLRELFQPKQLALLLRSGSEPRWLSADITVDRTPEVRRYVMGELNVSEVTPESLLPRLDLRFLNHQTDDWIVRLYEYLNKVPSVVPSLWNVPLIRLEDGTHVCVSDCNGIHPFLPTHTETEFPTVRRVICASPQAQKFLRSQGLTEPDLIDDVIQNLLSKYHDGQPLSPTYEADITRILRVFGTASEAQKERLVYALKSTPFVASIDLGDDTLHMDEPGAIYIATTRLKELFAGIDGIRMVNNSYDCLRGENVRELLEACGARRYIYPEACTSLLSDAEKRELRRKAGVERLTRQLFVDDYDLVGLAALLKQLPTLNRPQKAIKPKLLWEALIELLDCGNQRMFSGTYGWRFRDQWTASFDSHFVKQLNNAAWIPDLSGELHPPSSILFESLGWKANPFLQSKIQFKKPVVEELAKEIGIEPAVLDTLKRLGVTSVSDLMARFRVGESDIETKGDVAEVNRDASILADQSTSSPVDDASQQDKQEGERCDEEQLQQQEKNDACATKPRDRDDAANEPADHKVARNSVGTSPKHQLGDGNESWFTSYVSAHPDVDDEGRGLDRLTHTERMALEKDAIDLICSREPHLKIMPAGNTGFDLIETDAVGQPERWVEVKAMTGSLRDRPVGLSRVQFEFAQRHGEQYWLYVVERANEADRARIVKIQDPAGRAGTFTFDHGWIAIADIDELSEKSS